MGKRDSLTKSLAVAGTLLVWFPLLAPIVLAVLAGLTRGCFLLDYLMPAELCPSFLVGGGLLLWAAWRASARRRLIGWGFGLALASLGGMVGLAQVTGLASGATEPTGWQWMLVLALLAAYAVMIVVVGVGGLWLLRDLFPTRHDRPTAEAL